MSIPVLFIFFIKDTAKEVFNAIRKAESSNYILSQMGQER